MPPTSILLVEDNPDDEALTVRALRTGKVANDIVVVRDGVEALDWLFMTGAHEGRDPAMTPRLVLLDLNLPKLDGHGVLRGIRANPATRCLPVVMLTSSREERDIAASYALGANSFICKPVEFASFTETIRQVGKYWLTLNEGC